jgi:CPA2 family monovalent cation:H+ antiporter-2
MADPLVQTFLLIGAAFAAVVVLTRLRLSPIVGYLGVGLVLGPHGLGAVPEAQGTHFFGELGVALLMFVIGLEFSLPQLLAAGGSVFGLGLATVGAVTTVAALLCHQLAGLPILPSIIIGAAIAMSSTAIVHKHLIDTDEVSSRYGVAATAIVLFEDLVALTVLAIVAALHTTSGDAALDAVLLRLAISILAFVSAAILARRTLGRLLESVARSRSNEAFLLAVLTLITGAALAAQSIGLSLPIGAFVVGMIVGESDFRHQLEDEIRPFRDVLVGIFFITIGMSVDWAALLAKPGMTAGLLAAIMAVKFVVVFASRVWPGWTRTAPRAPAWCWRMPASSACSSSAMRSTPRCCRPPSGSRSSAPSRSACCSRRWSPSSATGSPRSRRARRARRWRISRKPRSARPAPG